MYGPLASKYSFGDNANTGKVLDAGRPRPAMRDKYEAHPWSTHWHGYNQALALHVPEKGRTSEAAGGSAEPWQNALANSAMAAILQASAGAAYACLVARHMMKRVKSGLASG